MTNAGHQNTAARSRAILFRAIPDGGRYEVEPDEPGGLGWPVSLRLSNTGQVALASFAKDVWLGPQMSFGNSWIFNGCQNADSFDGALQSLAELQTQTRSTVFNSPRAVQAIRPDRLGDTLSGVEGLTVPRTLRFGGNVEEAVRSSECLNEDWELAVAFSRNAPRLRSSSLRKKTEPIDLLQNKPFGGAPFYVSFFDREWLGTSTVNRYAVAKGSYVKCGDWQDVDAQPASKAGNVPDDETIGEICVQVSQMTGLDYFGLDLKHLPDGTHYLAGIGPDLSTMTMPFARELDGKSEYRFYEGATALFIDAIQKSFDIHCKLRGNP